MLTSLLTSLQYLKTQNKNGVNGRTPQTKPLLLKITQCCTSEVCKSALLAKYSVDRRNTALCVEKKKAQHTNIKTSSQLKYRAALLPQGLDSLLSSMEKRIQVYQDILQENVRLSVHQLKLNRS